MSEISPPLSVEPRAVRLHCPTHQDPADGEAYPACYGVGFVFQVSPTQVAVIAGRRYGETGEVDYDGGSDVLIIDSLDQLDPARAKPFARNQYWPHPETGEELEQVLFTPQIGFIPLGAKLADGRPHPHAGTGFALTQMRRSPTGSAHGPGEKGGATRYSFPHGLYLQQLRFDGQNLLVTHSDTVRSDALLPGWHLYHRGLGLAIPDGEDLIGGMSGGRECAASLEHAARLEAAGRKPYSSAQQPVGECYGTGVARWRHGPNGWHPVSFSRPTGDAPDMSFEGTVVRDLDGGILLSVRGKGANVPAGESDLGMENTYEHIRVYRSYDGGETWEQLIHSPETRSPTPVSINRAADGSIYVAGNPFRPLMTDSRGRTIYKIKVREQLWLWPLSDDRRSLQEPVEILDAVARFGPAVDTEAAEGIPVISDNMWFIDHPIGSTVQLADGKPRHLLAFRVNDSAIVTGAGPIRPHFGLWIEEVETPGEPIPVWRF